MSNFYLNSFRKLYVNLYKDIPADFLTSQRHIMPVIEVINLQPLCNYPASNIR